MEILTLFDHLSSNIQILCTVEFRLILSLELKLKLFIAGRRHSAVNSVILNLIFSVCLKLDFIQEVVTVFLSFQELVTFFDRLDALKSKENRTGITFRDVEMVNALINNLVNIHFHL